MSHWLFVAMSHAPPEGVQRVCYKGLAPGLKVVSHPTNATVACSDTAILEGHLYAVSAVMLRDLLQKGRAAYGFVFAEGTTVQAAIYGFTDRDAP